MGCLLIRFTVTVANCYSLPLVLKSSVLVIGAGGLGSPALLYLAACGLGRLGIIDHDVVELNNMHRQIIHTEAFIGHPKVKSAAAACRSINSTIKIDEYVEALRTSNALEILSQYPLDICNRQSSKPLHDQRLLCSLRKGAALGMEGQLTVYNHKGGPCYRCLFPTPPPTTACQRCSDSGVLGVVPGVIGCLQALETIKLASLVGEPLSERMLLFDALSARIRIVKIRGRSSQCTVCGDNSSFNKQQFRDFDYEDFTQFPLFAGPLNILPQESRITSKEFKEILEKKERHVLLDVRPAHHYKIVSLPDSLNIPLANLEARLDELTLALKEKEEWHASTGSCTNPSLYVVCRRGNDSQRAVEYLRESGFDTAKDIIGGLEAWARDVNPNFPTY
ncbi:hypothetical protein YC2023_022168 [Brassica napus]